MKRWSIVVLTAASLLAGVWIGFSFSEQRNRPRDTANEAAAISPSAPDSVEGPTVTVQSPDVARVAGLLLATHATPTGIQRHHRFDQFLQAITAENWTSTLPLIERARVERFLSTDEFVLCWQRLGEVAGKDLFAPIHEVPQTFARWAMRGWAARDPAEAKAYLAQNDNPYLVAGFAYAIGHIHPEAALQEYLRMSVDQQWSEMTEFAMEPALSPLVALWLEASSQLRFPENWSGGPDSIFRIMCTHNRGNKSPEERLAWLDRFAGRPYAHADNISALGEILSELPFADSAEWLTRFSASAPEKANETFQTFLMRTKTPTEASAWLAQHQDHPSYDHAATGYVENLVMLENLDVPAVEHWISTIRNESLRTRATESLSSRLRPNL